MEFSKYDVRKVAKLANLALTDDEVQRMAHDMGEVLTHMEQLATLDTSNVEAMAQVLFAAPATAFRSFIRLAICSRVSGPRRYDMAQRLCKTMG